MLRERKHPTCNNGPKRRYALEADAERALASVRRRVEQGRHAETIRPAIRTYICPYCMGWHLTSQPLAEREIEVSWRQSAAMDRMRGKAHFASA